jgi:fructose-1,6-bisphosphatase II
VDIAVDPLEGTNLVAKGLPGSIAVMAVAPCGMLLHAPDMYMEKIAVGARGRGCIDINAPVKDNLYRVAKAMERKIEDLVVVILDRERHQQIIREAREAGARIKLISDGDVSPVINAGIEGSGVHMLLGIGGAPEGVIAAAAMKCLGGDMQARLWPENEAEKERASAMGITDINKVFTIDDLVKGQEVFFTATAITEGDMLRGVQFFGGGARTHSISMRLSSGTVRFVDAIHTDKGHPTNIKL